MSDRTQDESHVVIIGAGPAGLTAAYQLNKLGIRSTIVEKDDIVGGPARTVRHNGYLFDVGGHWFFTKVAAVEQMWREVLGDDLLLRKRQSRILYKKKLFDYPLKPLNALGGLGAWNSALAMLSYVKAKISPRGSDQTFEGWISQSFRRAALSHLLQILYREGVGEPLPPDFRRMGQAANQRPVVPYCPQRCVHD